ncbi:ATP-binding cassette domain-containing protein [Bacillus sp. T33-2]|uniref:ATP-binding cassette domain-containing protein n=1 Tax=Bacillus sp. T33-2 TaxID=2054168 RepID=UPI0015E104B4|nr:ATP-binding cassette domain-containing protein [Bacillus sp. T33-2]
MNAVELKNVTKLLAGNPVISGLDLILKTGEATTVIGHNGSGKSTLIKLLAGIFEPTHGVINRMTARTAYVPESFPEQIRFRLREYLLLLGKMTGRHENELIKEIGIYADMFGITTYLDVPLKQCSKGTKQKAGIIQALLHKPELLLLDEPLTGLDPASQNELLNQLIELKQELTIVFTAHELLLVAGLADRVIEIKQGKIVSDQSSAKRELYRSIKVTCTELVDFKVIPGVITVHATGNQQFVLNVQAAKSDDVLKYLLEHQCSILQVETGNEIELVS